MQRATNFFILISALFSPAMPSIAQEQLRAQEPSSQSFAPADPQELEAFLDSLFQKKMEEQHVHGAVFVLVKDGQIFFSKGYGYADLENRVPVDPAHAFSHRLRCKSDHRHGSDAIGRAWIARP